MDRGLVRRGKIGSREKREQNKDKNVPMTFRCMSHCQHHDVWAHLLPSYMLFARIPPLLSGKREATYKPCCPCIVGQMDQMKAGNWEKHRVIAHRHEKLGMGLVCGEVVNQIFRKRMAGSRVSWTAAWLTNARQSLRTLRKCTSEKHHIWMINREKTAEKLARSQGKKIIPLVGCILTSIL